MTVCDTRRDRESDGVHRSTILMLRQKTCLSVTTTWRGERKKSDGKERHTDKKREIEREGAPVCDSRG